MLATSGEHGLSSILGKTGKKISRFTPDITFYTAKAHFSIIPALCIEYSMIIS